MPVQWKWWWKRARANIISHDDRERAFIHGRQRSQSGRQRERERERGHSLVVCRLFSLLVLVLAAGSQCDFRRLEACACRPAARQRRRSAGREDRATKEGREDASVCIDEHRAQVFHQIEQFEPAPPNLVYFNDGRRQRGTFSRRRLCSLFARNEHSLIVINSSSRRSIH